MDRFREEDERLFQKGFAPVYAEIISRWYHKSNNKEHLSLKKSLDFYLGLEIKDVHTNNTESNIYQGIENKLIKLIVPPKLFPNYSDSISDGQRILDMFFISGISEGAIIRGVVLADEGVYSKKRVNGKLRIFEDNSALVYLIDSFGPIRFGKL